jgi:protocatechuate 3,4-dioxygenase beta subunit
MSLSGRHTRRRFLANTVALATTLQLQRAAHALGLATSADVCKLMPEQEIGPYYVADELLRSNIVEGKPGIPLALRVIILDARTCKPLPDAAIDLWHCDALGLYAGFTKQNPSGPGFGGPGGPGGLGGPPPGFDPSHPGNHSGPPEGLGPPHENKPTDALTFLRGIQITGAEGRADFTTIFPGFYMGRTNHIHFKVRLGGEATAHGKGRTYSAGHVSHVGQIFFEESLNSELMQFEPYKSHAIHRTSNSEDGIFGSQHGTEAIAHIDWVKHDEPKAGLRAEMIVSVDPAATPAKVGIG